MYTITREYKFAAAHRIPGHPKCGRLHGHNYRILVEIATHGPLTVEGFVLDFGAVDDVIKPLIDAMDHRYLAAKSDHITAVSPEEDICWLDSPTTSAENLASYMHLRITQAINQQTHLGHPWTDIFVHSITVFETDRNAATYAPL